MGISSIIIDVSKLQINHKDRLEDIEKKLYISQILKEEDISPFYLFIHCPVNLGVDEKEEDTYDASGKELKEKMRFDKIIKK